MKNTGERYTAILYKIHKNCTWYPLGGAGKVLAQETRKQKQKEIMFLTHTVILFVSLTLAFQCLSLYSLVTMGRRIHVLESRSDSNNSASYLKQLVNLSLRGIAGGPESVNASKVLMTWRTDHSHTSDEVLDYD